MVLDQRPRANVGFLHPGEMGFALAKIARINGAKTWWASENRSEVTATRAADAGMTDVGSVLQLARCCEILICICPPHAAVDVASAVAASGFTGIYVDANAIAPGTARNIGTIIERSGGTYVDAGIVGPPPNGVQDTVLFLSGVNASLVSRFFSADALYTEILGSIPYQASAVKICHSAMHKGQLALLFATIAVAEHQGVLAPLQSLWERRPETQTLSSNMPNNTRRAAKAWRFAGEMKEVAAAMEASGLPPEMHIGASAIFQRLTTAGASSTTHTTDDLIRTLLSSE